MNRTPLVVSAIALTMLAAAGAAWFVTQSSDAPAPEPTPDPKSAPPVSPRGGALARGKIRRGLQGKGRLKLFGPQRMLDAPTGPAPDGPDLIFITWDTVRADRLSLYGFSRETTPELERLGRTGLVFEQFIVPQATTLPSHISMFTGTHPEEHGITANSEDGKAFVPPEDLPTLAKHLNEQGYRTAGFISSTPLKSHSGIHEGFQVWDEPRTRDRHGAGTTSSALRWVAGDRPDRPLFMWVHYYDPHAPYMTPDGTQSLFTEPMPEWTEPRRVTAAGGRITVPKRLSNYDRELFVTDRETARLIEGLEKRKRDRVIVIAGDHGEGLGQHEHVEHGLLWTEQLHAPLMVLAPGVKPARVKTLTAAKDILPTLMGLADFPDEEGLLAKISGRDVLADPSDVPVFSRTSSRQARDLRHGGNHATAWSLTTNTHTFMWSETDAPRLFDRASDPHQLTNIASENSALVDELTQKIAAQRAVHAERAEEFGAGRTEPMDAALIRNLEELGYLEPDEP